MIKKLEVNNYKMFKNFQLGFSGGINLICGPNGSGKSSLLEVLDSLGRFLSMHDVSDHIAISVGEAFPFSSFCRWEQEEKGSGDLKIDLEVDGKDNAGSHGFEYHLLVRYNFLDRICRVQKESLTYIDNQGKPSEIISFTEGVIKMQTDDGKELSFNGDWNRSGLVPGGHNNSKIRRFGEIMAHITTLHLLPFKMEQDFPPVPPVQKLGKWGENFPAWRFNYAREYPEEQLPAFQVYKNFIPGLQSVKDMTLGDLYRLTILVKYNDKTHKLLFNELSDGQKKLLAMYSLLASARSHTTLCIDEPENYLSVGELQPWLDAMHDAWEERDIQFIIISHNPKTLNWHHKEAIILTVKGTPPRIVPCAHDSEISLIEELNEMEWEET